MYHYVRPIIGSEYPEIKGLELKKFKRQLDYLSDKFNFIRSEELNNALKKDKKLPKNACWLTFDDGYLDHIKYVFPELKSRGIQGSFFPPKYPIVHRKILDVNAIHYILASCEDKTRLRTELDEICLDAKISQAKLAEYWEIYGKPNRFDSAEIIYIKRMLQHALPESLRNEITQKLFELYVRENMNDFASKIYMSIKDLKILVDSGMYVGSHGSMHYWLDRLSFEEQAKDIEDSLNLLEEIKAPTSDWFMCYPYGAYNQSTLDVLAQKKCSLAVTTEVAQASISYELRYKLPRFDTNDFPQ